MPVRVRLECGRRQLLIEQLIRIVFAALQLGDDHRPLRLAIVRMVEAVRHALRLDEQHAIERVPRGRLEIRRLVDEGVAVPAAAELLDDPFHLIAGNVGRPLEVHVLDPVRNAGEARAARPSSRPCTSTRPTRAARCVLPERSLSARYRAAAPLPGSPSVHYRIVGYPCLSGKTPSTCRAPTFR